MMLAAEAVHCLRRKRTAMITKRLFSSNSLKQIRKKRARGSELEKRENKAECFVVSPSWGYAQQSVQAVEPLLGPRKNL